MRELLDRSLGEETQVELKLADDLWPVHVDPGELELVILNLAVNARDAMPGGGTITISADNLSSDERSELRGDWVRLAVIDSGARARTMPGNMDGVELGRQIRLHRQSLPILLTSGYANGAQEAEREGTIDR